MGWGSVARDNVHVLKGWSGCVISLGTGRAYAMKCN